MSSVPAPAPDSTTGASALSPTPTPPPGSGSTPAAVVAPRASGPGLTTSPGYPYESDSRTAGGLLIAAVLVVVWTGMIAPLLHVQLTYTGGDAAALIGVLLVLALVLKAPALIMDDDPAAGGEPSTMRILTIAIVLTFCALMLKSGWDKQALPSLENQGNWVWLITAAIGGKALQKFAEVKEEAKK